MKKIIFFILFSSTVLTAQTNDQNNSRIKVYTPSGSSKAAETEAYKWTVKTDIFSFVGGEFPIIGEYRFAKKLSVEASAGVTYGFLPNSTGLFEFEDESAFESKATMGSAFRAGIKFYPSSDYDAIEGWAFGVQVYTKTTNREYDDEYMTEYSMNFSGQEDSKVKTGIALTISKQIFWDSNISVESFLGLGFASVKHDYLVQGDYNDQTGLYNVTQESEKETRPNIQLGLRIGFGN